ncbi:MAG TPA: beta-propeller fold lactonase family protein [Thermomicrobiales bacterium]|nr:beta-propeller fold lactonase family protein [Thermomicrobiales bacterium]
MQRTHRTSRIFWLLTSVLMLLGAVPATTAAKGGPELWIMGQDTSRIFILKGSDLQETVQLPAGTGPHMTRFSPDGRFAYVSGVVSGDLIVLDAQTHEIIQTLDLGTSGVHEAAPSPDGSELFVAQQTTRELIRVAVDPQTHMVTETGRLALPASPVCTILMPDSNKAYVTLSGQDLAIVDTVSMQITGMIDINGQARCNYDWATNGKLLYLTSENGTDSFVYVVDPTTDTPSLLYTFSGVRDIHSLVVNPNEKQISIIGRASDRYYTLTLSDLSVTSFELGTPGVSDQPDAMVIVGNTAYVNLKASGRLATIQLNKGTISYLDLATPSANAALNVIRRHD